MGSEKEGESAPPLKLTCYKHFDALWFCYSPVHQLQQYYRLGALDNCSGKWSALYDCLRLKTKRASEVELFLRKIRHRTSELTPTRRKRPLNERKGVLSSRVGGFKKKTNNNINNSDQGTIGSEAKTDSRDELGSCVINTSNARSSVVKNASSSVGSPRLLEQYR